MANSFGFITPGTQGTGASAISFTGFGFNPNDLEFTVGMAGSSSSTLQSSVGAVDSGGGQAVISRFDNYSGQRTFNSSGSDCIWVQSWNGSAWVDVLRCYFHSYITDGFKLNVSVASSSYPVFVKARRV